MLNFLRKIVLTPILWALTRVFIQALKYEPELTLRRVFGLDIDLDQDVRLTFDFNLDGVSIYDENDNLIKTISHNELSASIDEILDKWWECGRINAERKFATGQYLNR